jgi:Holliday junction resolvase RusA-like endonuclease
MPMTILTLPLPPSVNTAFTNQKFTGKHIYTDASKDWYHFAWATIQAWKIKNGFKEPFDNYIKTHCNFYLHRKGSDSHNFFKLTADALEKFGIVTNDKYIMFMTEKIDYDKVNPRIEITFEMPLNP